ncbi:MAG: DUF1146 family protein [Alicyclobacillaceae bacterium]|uniref:DUF1146 family protein n=1 Tax=Alicyclobacillus sp. SP_1 TaxID=2942475 RepID=UPI00215833E7|nr:DUF1146 family protein [Alicyclobacillus sp. SP_1]MCY0888722.1 DUF1146 family protein [Alicyclobacillaceae bacterium]MCY0896584.1 DUF1146 family protein [Alicyclobacillaceae bacterium]
MLSSANNVSLASEGFVLVLFFFVGLLLTWWALGVLKWESFTRLPLSSQAQMLRFLMAMFGGFLWTGLAALFLYSVDVMRLL